MGLKIIKGGHKDPPEHVCSQLPNEDEYKWRTVIELDCGHHYRLRRMLLPLTVPQFLYWDLCWRQPKLKEIRA